MVLDPFLVCPGTTRVCIVFLIICIVVGIVICIVYRRIVWSVIGPVLLLLTPSITTAAPASASVTRVGVCKGDCLYCRLIYLHSR